MAMYGIELNYQTELSGYVATEYLTTNSMSKDNYKIEDNYIIVTPGTKISNIEGATTTDENFTTGIVVKKEDVDYNLVILGDPNGDGIINSADLLKIVKHLKGTATLEGTTLRAADCNNDGTINSADLLKIVKYLKETGSITL